MIVFGRDDRFRGKEIILRGIHASPNTAVSETTARRMFNNFGNGPKLLTYNGDRLTVARQEAWEGRRPANIRALLADPIWEARLLRFIELSGAGRAVDGEDVEEWATRMDGKRRKGLWHSRPLASLPLFSFVLHESYPALCMRLRRSISLFLTVPSGEVWFVSSVLPCGSYIPPSG
jgi:hypothetical protein